MNSLLIYSQEEGQENYQVEERGKERIDIENRSKEKLMKTS